MSCFSFHITADLYAPRSSTNYVFSYDRMLDMKVRLQDLKRHSKSMDRLIFKALQGNTAVYLLYTHARISTLLSRAEDQVLTNTQRV